MINAAQVWAQRGGGDELTRGTRTSPAADRAAAAEPTPPGLLGRRSSWSLASVASGLLVLLPLATVFHEAFAKGFEPIWPRSGEPDALAAMRLTLMVAAIAVPLNAVFGVAAAWAIAQVRVRGQERCCSR